MLFIPSVFIYYNESALIHSLWYFISSGTGMIVGSIGNLIKNQFLTARNWPFGAAISIILILITFCLVKIYKKLGGDMDELGGF